MTRLLPIVLLLGTVCCEPDHKDGSLYISSHALDKFDSAVVTVIINDKVIYDKTVTNKYLSFHWDQKSFHIPLDSFRVTVNVSGQGFAVKKDTTFNAGEDRTQMFITFDFYPYYKRYHNHEIYSHVDTGTFDLKKVADSLYRNNILKNADSFLNDTIPLQSSIDIVFKKPEKRIL